MASEATKRTEALAKCFASFPAFCGLLSISPKEGGGRIPLILSPIQRAYQAVRTSRDVVLKPRQVHMTTLEAARDFWWFVTKPGARVVAVCQSQGDHGALIDIAYKFRIFVDSMRRLGIDLDFGKESGSEWTLPKRDSTLRLIQAGGSEIAASRKGRGGTINRLHLTEMAFWGDYAKDTFLSLTDSVLREGSEIVNESTPNGAGGLYYEQWRAAVDGTSAYTPHFFPWWLHPDYRLKLEPGEVIEPRTDAEKWFVSKRVPPECIKWHRWKVLDKGGDAESVSQEFPNDPDTCFLVSGRAFFDAATTERLIKAAKAPTLVEKIRGGGAAGEIRYYGNTSPGATYVLALDPSEGTGGDPTSLSERKKPGDPSAGTVRERGTGRHLATIHGQIPPWELAKIAAMVGRKFGGATIAVERNNHGHAVLRALDAEQKYPNIFRDHDGRPGWLTTEVSRTPALDALAESHRRGQWTSSDIATLGELRTFVVTERGKAEAQRGAHDDLVMAEAICWDVLCRRMPKRDLTNLPAR